MELSNANDDNSGWAAANNPNSSQFDESRSNALDELTTGGSDEDELEDESNKYDTSGGGWVPLGSTTRTRRRNLTSLSSSSSSLPSSLVMKRNRETAEAAVSRLTTCYQSALKCLGALHKLDKAFVELLVLNKPPRRANDDGGGGGGDDPYDATTTATLLQLQEECYHVARCAKSLLQHVVLSDPLLSRYTPTLQIYLNDLTVEPVLNAQGEEVNTANTTTTTTTTTLSSTHHKALRNLAYLSLLNYADLLMLGTYTPPRTQVQSQQRQDILSQGVIPYLQCFIHNNGMGLWEDNNIRHTKNHSAAIIRLALSAYIDATQIDSTDPTTWLKLACAARALSRIEQLSFCLVPTPQVVAYPDDSNKLTTATTAVHNDNTKSQLFHCKLDCYRLEIYAIQRGILAVPPNLPPNRLLLMARHSLLDANTHESSSETDSTHTSTCPLHHSRCPNNNVIIHATHHTLHLNLNRYSWNTLGRSLLRAHRDVSSFSSTVQYYHCSPIEEETIKMKNAVADTNLPQLSRNWAKEELLFIPSDNKVKNPYYQDHPPNASFGSPTVEIHIVPIIAYLSVSNLSIVCSFLDILDVKRLEISCRAISSAVMAMRARIDGGEQQLQQSIRQDVVNQKPRQQQHQQLPTEEDVVISSAHRQDIQDTSVTVSDNMIETSQPNNITVEPICSSNLVVSDFGGTMEEETQIQLAQDVPSHQQQQQRQQQLLEREDTSARQSQAEASSNSTNRKGQNRTRSSTRVRSQRLLSHDRQSVDSSHRISLDRCVAVSIFGCNLEYPFQHSISTVLSRMTSAEDSDAVNEYARLVGETLSAKEATFWIEHPSLRKGAEVLRKTSIFKKYNADRHRRSDSTVSDFDDTAVVNSSAIAEELQVVEKQSRIGQSSLNSFVKSCGRNSGPLDIMERYLAHISLHVQDIFTSEQSNDGVMMLSSCLLDCFDLVASRDGPQRSLAIPYWVSSIKPTALLNPGTSSSPNTLSNTSAIDVSQGLKAFSMNLLAAELKLRQCDRQQLELNDIDSDSTAVSFLVPTLVEIVKAWTACGFVSNEEASSIRTAWHTLTIRTHWLASMFYLWWSRCSVDPALSSRFEQLSLYHLDKAVEAFDSVTTNRTKILLTPHLESPSRTGKHWKELSKHNLIAYKEEIQAASIVSHARLEFMHIRDKLQASSREQEKEEINVEGEYIRLKELGRGLLGRYDEYKRNADRYEDLIRDFLSSSDIKDMLLHAGKDYRYERPLHDSKCFDPIFKWGSKLWDVIPCSIDSMKSQLIGSTSHPSQIEILAVCCVQDPELYVSFLLILVRLVISAHDQRSKLKSLKMKNFWQEASLTPFFSDRESSSEESEDCESESSSVENRGRGDKCERLLLLAAKFFMEKITQFLTEIRNQNGCIQSVASFREFISSAEVQAVLQISFCIAAKSSDLVEFHPILTKSDKCEFGTDRSHGFDSSKAASTLSSRFRFFPDRSMLWISYRLTDSLLSFGDGNNLRSLEILLFILLSKSLVEEQNSLASVLLQRGDRRSRSMKHRTCLAIGDFVSDIAVMFSDLLLRFPFKKSDGRLLTSSLAQSSAHNPLVSGKDDHESRSLRIESSALELASLIQLSDSLLWFWKHFSTIGAPDTGLTAFRAADATIVKSLSQRLDASIACALISLFGSFVNYRSISFLGGCKETVADDFENDTVDCLSSSDDEHGNSISCTMAMKRWIFTLSTAVRGISVIYNGVKDRNTLSLFAPERRNNGPLLPLAVSNTLNNIADIFLDTFKKSHDTFLVETYPQGLETIGSEIDSLLSKAYGSLHGFTLTGGSQDILKSVRCFPPETLKATLRIFRLMKRLYPVNGRRMPPRAALEFVLKYLPETKRKEQDAAIRNFIFSHPVASDETVTSLIQKDEELNSNLFPPNFPLWILEAKSDTTTSECQEDVSGDLDLEGIPWKVLQKVQFELTCDLARVPIPRMELCSSNHSKSSVPVGDETPEGSCLDEREVLARHEFAIWQKIDTIINYLCFSPDDCKGWFDIAQCLSSKADYIRDRLVTKDDEYVERNFFPWPSVFTKERHSRAYSLEELNRKLTMESERVDLGSLPSIGRDLSVYLRNPWSTIPTLHTCVEELSRMIFTDETTHEPQYEQETSHLPQMTEIVAFNCVQSLEPPMWQNAWGGLYVGALQRMAKKCLQVTYCLAKSLTDRNRTESFQLVAEVCEAIGTMLYKELQGSWQYGFPICRMTGKKKYDLAEQAANSYKESLDLAMSSSGGKEDFNATWGLQLMIGKCYEKMAKVYSLEQFYRMDNQTEQPHSIRKYAQLLEKAFRHYSASLERVRIAEEEGILTEQPMGGSSHGSIEVVYRIHASRLKILLHAVCQNKKIRRSFEAEALNLISNNWFSEPIEADNEQQCLNLNDREKRWEVLVDIVSAFVFCRQEKGLFHRSVYRHAQAILWAPIVYEPDADCYPLLTNTEGMFAQPTALSNVYQDVVYANAAKTVMESIFDKKRTQLCATWLESRFHRPFEELNQSEKKFDLVRLKYIAARIELLRVCHDIESLQTFLSWASACLPDLPNLYFATAQSVSASRHDHRHDNLLKGSGFLRNVKRLCTMAIADVIKFHIHQHNENIIPNGTRSMTPMELLRIAYSCYLKLNCTIEDLSGLVDGGEESVIEVDALLSAFDRVKGTLAENTVLKEKLKAIEIVDHNSKKIAQLQAVLTTCKALFHLRKHKRKCGGEKGNVPDAESTLDATSRKRARKT
jgi:hypothetical protein